MDTRIIAAAIFEAEKELDSIKEQLVGLEPLLKRRASLEHYIAQSRALLAGFTGATIGAAAEGVAKAEGTAVPTVTGSPSIAKAGLNGRAFHGAPLWQGARDVLSEAKHPMNAPDVSKALVQRGGWRDTKGAVEQVRTAMFRRPDVFDRLGNGLYALRDWPAELKRVA